MPVIPSSNNRRPVAQTPANTQRAPAARPAAGPAQKRVIRPANSAPATQAPRPVPARPQPYVEKWNIEKFRNFYEQQVEHAQELLEIGDNAGAKETLESTFKRLQQGCRQFESTRPLWKVIQQWTADVKNRFEIVRDGGSLTPASSNGSGSPLANPPESANAKDLGEIEALVEACVPEQKANITWDDVIGIDEAVSSVKEAIDLPFKFPQFFASGSLQPWRGVLLWGPPGTGKTLLAQAAANSVNAKFYVVSAADMVSKWMGQGEKFVKALFASARLQPSIIFIDEIDSILKQRGDGEHDALRRIKTQFLQEMEGFKPTQRVTVIGATNLPWEMDDAALRRFEARPWIPLPSEEARRFMFKHKLSKFPHCLTDADFDTLARQTYNHSGADIEIIIKKAAYMPLKAVAKATHIFKRADGFFEPCAPDAPGSMPMPSADEVKDIPFDQNITMQHVMDALAVYTPSLDSTRLEKYDEYKERIERDKQQNG